MKRNLILSILCILFSLNAYTQVSIDSLLAYSAKRWAGFPMESIYLQTSKDVYETGEDLWFKAYQLDAQTFGLSDRSKTLYLQMINPKDSVVWQEKYPVENGIVTGHVYVDEKLLEGDYLVQAYTRYSFYQNDSTGIISARRVKIVKSIAHLATSEVVKDSTFRFEMFPEGGNLVSGIPTKLAFKATDGNGNPVFIEGAIYQNGELLSYLKSVHNGMGSVLFTPYSDKAYKIELSNGKSYLLPEIHPEGMVLRLTKQDNQQLSFIVSQSADQPSQPIYLVGQMRGLVCCMAKGTLKDNLKISIPTDNFLFQGIAEFTLFDASMRPIVERLVFVHPEKKLYITAEPEKKEFATREKATVKIKVTDEDGKPIRANLGISVYDRAYNNPTNPMNILSYAYLSSQIRGRIYDPTYYFDERKNDRTEGLELLLLTQGWRRYVWGMKQPTYQGKPFLTDEIEGIQTLKSKKESEQNQGTEQLIQVSGATGNSLFTWADSTGHFTVSTDMMKELQGGCVYLKPMLSKEFKPVLELADYFPLIDSIKRYRSYYYPIANLSQFMPKQEFDLPVVSGDSKILLNEVTIMGKGRNPFRDKMMGRLDSLAQMKMGVGWVCECKDPSYPYLNDYESGFTHHPLGLSGYSGKRLSPERGKTYRLIKYEPNSNGDWFLTKMKTVVYSGTEYTEEELLRMNNLWRTKGYYVTREFYCPDEVDMKSSIPDARNTLFWSPSVTTDEKGEATFSFYCSDVNTGFVGVVEGVDGAGLLGSSRCEFKVMRK